MLKNEPKWILIHTSDYPRSKLYNQLTTCDGWHKDRDFPKSSVGYYIGYHVLITGEKIYQTRLDTDEGAHCNQKVDGVSLNFQSLGVCIGFDGDIEPLTSMEYALLQKQVWEWQDKYKIPNENVKFHRFFATDKTCPGFLIKDSWLTQLLTRPVPVVNIPPKPTERMCVAQEKEIVALKKEVEGYKSWFSWFVRRFS